MKSFIYTLLFAFVFCGLTSAQQLKLHPKHDEIHENPEKEKSHLFSTQHREKDDISGWYNYGQELYDLGGDVDWIRNVLFPDSTVVVEFSGGVTGPVWKHSLGQIFDPKSGYFAIDNPVLPDFVEYTIDSVRVYYRYNRFQTSLPDTLVVQCYKQDGLTEGNFGTVGQNDYYTYAHAEFDHQTVTGTNESKRITYLLEDKDATELTAVLSFPVDIQVDKGEIFGVSLSYFPGNPHNPGDTIDPLYAPIPNNRINAFTVFEFRDKAKVHDPDFLNNGMVARTSVRYNIDNQGWNGMYIPGQAFFNLTYHLDVDFHLTALNVPVGVIKNELDEIQLFPNPAKDIVHVKVDSPSDNIRISMVDLTGRVVLEEIISSRKNQQSIDISELSPGTYHVLMMDNSNMRSQLLVISE